MGAVLAPSETAKRSHSLHVAEALFAGVGLNLLLVGALLTGGLRAVPVAEDSAQSEVSDTRKIFQRSGQLCRVLSKDTNCRTGPGTNFKRVVGLSSSWTRGYYFTCVKTGECVTLNGAANCGWHYLEEEKCYVNGHYTDSSCTLAPTFALRRFVRRDQVLGHHLPSLIYIHELSGHLRQNNIDLPDSLALAL
ncbi:hypothetical protein N7492_007392 [Penicillium capsulatum]|uniref:Uncharacterized protein n=1 Tax=Penicillium capsulatum TaxID=69766 RepID=A0A9W9I3R0_9EURO|nr:hypothetical protein N7492_007392 [Penicillium capsulatum]KAJ6117232.1 hypothetical protein N7512_006957 [Penicillium capsulatum]